MGCSRSSPSPPPSSPPSLSLCFHLFLSPSLFAAPVSSLPPPSKVPSSSTPGALVPFLFYTGENGPRISDTGPIVRNSVVERWARPTRIHRDAEWRTSRKREDKDERGGERIERSAASGSGAIIWGFSLLSSPVYRYMAFLTGSTVKGTVEF